MIFLSPPREDEPRERKVILGTRKEGQQIRALRIWPAIERQANGVGVGGAVYPGRERQREWASAGHSEAQSQEISGNCAGQQGHGERAVPRLEEFGPPETHGKLVSESRH